MTTIIEPNQALEKWDCDEREAVDTWRSIEWARNILERPDVVYLDTETTGLEGAYLVEIAILSRYGSTMLDTLIRPPIPCESGAEKVHGITKEMLQDAPSFPEIYPRLQEILSNRHVVIYNSKFDVGILNNCCDYYELPRLKFTTSCAMNKYAAYYGEWSGYWGNYRWQKLPGGSHRAAADAWACYQLVKKMAISPSCDLKSERMFPPIQLFCKWREIALLQLEWHKPNGYYRYARRFPIKLPHFYWKTNKKPVEKKVIDDDDDIPW